MTGFLESEERTCYRVLTSARTTHILCVPVAVIIMGNFNKFLLLECIVALDAVASSISSTVVRCGNTMVKISFAVPAIVDVEHPHLPAKA